MALLLVEFDRHLQRKVGSGLRIRCFRVWGFGRMRYARRHAAPPPDDPPPKSPVTSGVTSVGVCNVCNIHPLVSGKTGSSIGPDQYRNTLT